MTVVNVEQPADIQVRESIERRASYLRALLGIYGATSLALGAAFGPVVMAFAVLAVGAVFLIGWSKLIELDNIHVPRVTLGVILVAAVISALFGSLTTTTFVAVFAVIACFLAEMFRHDGRPHLIEQISGTISGAVFILSGSLWILVTRVDGGDDVVIVGAITLAAVALMHAFDTQAARVAGFINGIVFGVGLSLIVGITPLIGFALGLSIAIVYLISSRLVEDLPRPSPRLQGASRAMIPLLAVGVIGYVMVEIFV